MRVAINHETRYRYEGAASYSIQYLRLTPHTGPHQRVLSWRLSVPGSITPWTDSFGNAAHVLVVDAPHDEIAINATGEVEIAEGPHTLSAEFEPHPPELYLRSTALTEPDPLVVEFAERFRKLVLQDPGLGLEHLMLGVRAAIDYRPGVTDVDTTASQVLAAGAGVCQDHAHLFIACARVLGMAARYVSGYLCAESGSEPAEMASHAWVEAWVDTIGWLPFDIAHRTTDTRSHVRLAVGRDYLDAAPVRGVRRQGGAESLDVAIHINHGGKPGPAVTAKARVQQQQQQ